MSMEEIKAMIDAVKNLKHRTIIMLLYSTGMRVSEIASLKITDIDSKIMRIKIVQGKGSKDRFTILSETVLQELRAYYIIYKPAEYLFNGSCRGKKMSVRNIQHTIQITLALIGLSGKSYSVHTIRHSFATHLVDNGTDYIRLKNF